MYRNLSWYVSKLCILCVITCALCLSACALPLASGRASLSIALPSSAALRSSSAGRSVANPAQLASWKLSFSGPVERAPLEVPASAASITVDNLALGHWSFRLQGLDSASRILYQAEGQTEIVSGVNVLTLSLFYAPLAQWNFNAESSLVVDQVSGRQAVLGKTSAATEFPRMGTSADGPGPDGGYLLFPQAGDPFAEGSFVDLGAFDLGRSFSLNFWLRPSDAIEQKQVILSNQAWASPDGEGLLPSDGFSLVINPSYTNAALILESSNGGAPVSLELAQLSNNFWHLISLAIDLEARQYRLRIDGQASGGTSGAQSFTDTQIAQFATSSPNLRLGAYNEMDADPATGTGSACFLGSLDELSIFAALLSQADRRAPAAPSNLRISGYNTETDELRLSWDESTSPGASYALTVGPAYHPTELIIPAGTSSVEIDLPSDDFSFRVRAVNAFGSSAASQTDYVYGYFYIPRPDIVLAYGQSINLNADFSPGFSLAPFLSEGTLTWSSSNEGIATIDSDGSINAGPSLSGAVTIRADFNLGGYSTNATINLYVDESGFPAGSGTQADPYIVSNDQELNLVRYALNASFLQSADIDLVTFDPWVPIGTNGSEFAGSYDGANYGISNLNCDTSGNDPSFARAGLFGMVGSFISSATIRRVRLYDANVSGELDVGTLAGTVSGESLISNCSATGSVTCTSATPLQYGVGGLVGSIYTAAIESCAAAVAVNSSHGDIVGGLVGALSGSLRNSYARGSVYGPYQVGGLVGNKSFLGSISACYSTGGVTGTDNLGGLIGTSDNTEGPVTDCYWDNSISNQTSSAGGSGVVGLDTAALQTDTPFPNWSATLWLFASGSYPVLVGAPPLPF